MMEELPTVKLRTKKRVYVLIGIYLLTMTILLASLLIQESKPEIWGCFVLLAISSLLVFSSVLTDQPSLKLTLKGFESRMLFVTRKVRWLDIAEITDYKLNNNRVLGLNYIQGRTLKSSPFNRNWSGFDDSLTNWSTLKFDEFHDLVNSYWEHAKQAQALELSKQVVNPRLKAD